MQTNKHETQEYSVGIVGYGFVGRAMHHLFPKAIVHDKYPDFVRTPGYATHDEINQCEIVFICVPTDAKKDGSVDLSAVKEVLGWLNGPIAVIKSTVPPDSLISRNGVNKIYDIAGKNNYKSTYLGGAAIVFNPEFLTERNWKSDVENETRIVLGDGSHNKQFAKKVARLYQKVYGQDVAYLYTSPAMAMMTKYVSNAFLATKVAFCNEIYDICQKLGLDYDQLRELWLYDKRVGRSHTLVTEQRGFGGYCLPKDLKGLINTALEAKIKPDVLLSVDHYNEVVRKRAKNENNLG